MNRLLHILAANICAFVCGLTLPAVIYGTHWSIIAVLVCATAGLGFCLYDLFISFALSSKDDSDDSVDGRHPLD